MSTLRTIGRFLAILLVCVTSGAGADRPNILFAISDDQSWMHAGAYGDKGTRTPAFDRVAREGVLFQHAFAAAPSCMPSRSAILTGRNIWEIDEAGVLMGTLKGNHPLFTLLLEKAGYQLAATGKTWGPGKLEGFATKDGEPLPPRSYVADQTQAITGRAYTERELKKPKRGMSETDYAANFADFLRERDKAKPFFFWYGATEPHQGYEVGAWKRAGKKLADARVPGSFPDDPVVRGEFLDYGLEIEHFDRHLSKMIEALETADLLQNTLIVVTSDHGNPMPRSKCNLYDTGTRVPLAIRFPERIPSGRTVSDFVNLIDLAPTFLEAAGLASPKVMSARSLWPVLSSSKSGQVDPTRDFAVTAFERHIIARRNGAGYPMRSIRTARYAYIRNYEPDRWPAGDPDFYSSHQRFYGDCDVGSTKTFLIQNSHRDDVHPHFLLAFGRRPAEELFDMESDPDQLHNIANDPKFAEVKKHLEARMTAYLKKTGDPRMNGEAPWDSYPFVDEAIFKRPDWQIRGGARKLRK